MENQQSDGLQFLPSALHGVFAEARGAPSWIRLKRAIKEHAQLPRSEQGPEVRVQILSTFTTEAIDPALEFGLRSVHCHPRLWHAPLNTVDQQLLDSRSAVYSEQCLASIVLWRVEELIPEVLNPYSHGGPQAIRSVVDKFLARLEALCEAHLHHGSSPLLLSTLMMPARSGNLILDADLGDGIGSSIARINARIFELGSTDPRLRVLDLNRWAALEGAQHYDARMDFLGRQPFSLNAATSLGLFIGRNLGPLIWARKKVLALDLDNTLWGGILGEDGPENLKLGHDFPGNIYLQIQRHALELKSQGILLVLLSKNDEAEVRKCFEALPVMLLSWDDFVACRVNYHEKAANLRDIAAELNLGVDSFVFLDDSDFERAQMNCAVPEVLVLNSAGDPIHMLHSLLNAGAFDARNVGEDDLKRHADYRQQNLRRAALNVHDGEGFLDSLELHATLERIDQRNIQRAVQLLGKTNQFNLTTRRHGIETVEVLRENLPALCLVVRVKDKFGEQGIVGLIIAQRGATVGSVEIDSFLISCRVIGRGVEHVLWAALSKWAMREGVQTIDSTYIPTAKNGLVANFYDELGFQRVGDSSGTVHYTLKLLQSVEYPTWIHVDDSEL